MDERAFERDSYCRALASEVVECGVEEGRPWARLATTIFYPEGGGQPADRGRLGAAAVVDVQRRDERIYHFLDRPAVLGPVELELDWARRFEHMQQHTGQHVLTSVCKDRHGLATRAFHLGETYSAIDLDPPALDEARMTAAEDRVNEIIRDARPVRVHTVTPEEMAQLEVRTRGFPASVGERIRLIEVEGIDRNTCGGTHVRNTAELQVCRLVGTEKMHGMLRLKFVFGGRAVARMRAQDEREAALKEVLGAGPEAFPEVAAGWDRERRALQRALRQTEAELAAALATGLAAAPEALVVRHLAGRDAGFLRQLGTAVLAAAPAKALVLFGDDGTAAFFLVAAGEAAECDTAALGARLAAALGGKGGGKGRTYQGRGPDAGRIPAAMKTVAG
ncbi:MAG: alanyl-tRNA editing protein [Planctomycetes bacterium]|nr:alanyl-tRNA editing protein [Planctomycetota bacterium]